MDAETPQTPSVADTSSPQAATANLGASDSSSFQQSANADALKQNTPLQVTSTGQPVTAAKSNANMSTAAIIFIVVSSVVLVMASSTVFRWFMKRPEPVKAEKLEDKTKELIEKAKVAKPKKVSKAKKVPRSKRKK